MANYSYPIDLEWSHEEMNKVIKLWNAVEEAYEKGIQVEAFKKAYQEFKTVVRSIGEEKRLGREFEEASGYSLYRVVQASKNVTKIIHMEGLKK